MYATEASPMRESPRCVKITGFPITIERLTNYYLIYCERVFTLCLLGHTCQTLFSVRFKGQNIRDVQMNQKHGIKINKNIVFPVSPHRSILPRYS